MHNTIVFVTLKLLMYFFLARKDMLVKIRKKDIYIFYTFDWRFLRSYKHYVESVTVCEV